MWRYARPPKGRKPANLRAIRDVCECWPPRYLTRVTTPIASLSTRGDRHRYGVVSRFLGSTPSNRRGAHRFIQRCCAGCPNPVRGKVLTEPVDTIRSMWTVQAPPISPTSVGRSRRKKVVLQVSHSVAAHSPRTARRLRTPAARIFWHMNARRTRDGILARWRSYLLRRRRAAQPAAAGHAADIPVGQVLSKLQHRYQRQLTRRDPRLAPHTKRGSELGIRETIPVTRRGPASPACPSQTPTGTQPRSAREPPATHVAVSSC
jgi:hypothetical protein